jgi:predicted nucleic acid-binding Zn ribbon protein
MSSNIIVKRVCEFCHKEFTAKPTTTRFCSKQCSNKSSKRKKRALQAQQKNWN